MAVDIKQLRIGSHILIDGKRERVGGIRPSKLHNSFQVIIQHEASDFSSFGYVPSASDMIEPIPITPELLTELGFEDCAKKRWHTEDWEKRWGECQYLSFTKLYRGEWRVHYFDGAKDRGQTVVRYLHEAEAFLALHGVELIKE